MADVEEKYQGVEAWFAPTIRDLKAQGFTFETEDLSDFVVPYLEL